MRECFIPKEFTHAHSAVIRKANEIISVYRRAGFTLTVRQIYYQFVARDFIENTIQSYKRLASILNDARLAGRIDWDAIEDRTRNLETPASWDNPEAIMGAVAKQFRLDPWETQNVRVEIWIEKEALAGIVEPICRELRIPFLACRGYTSQSEAYGAGRRLGRYIAEEGKERVIVFHLGDHDPSGLQMTEDNRNRVQMFARQGQTVELHRIALTMDQIDEYSPPPNPVKETDSRTRWYREQTGSDSSWELDALNPTIISELISGHVRPLIDQEAWDTVIARETEDRDLLKGVTDHWSRIAERPWTQKTAKQVRDEAETVALNYVGVDAGEDKAGVIADEIGEIDLDA